MNGRIRSRIASSICAMGLCALACSMSCGAAQAQGKNYEMKISTPTIHDVPDTMGANFLAAVEKDSGGRIKGQVYPASQLGSIPRQIEGTQFGSIQCAIIPPEFFVGLDERYEVLAAPGLVSSLAQGQKVAADPAVLKLMLSLGAKKGLHGVGLFMAEPSDVISKTPIRHLTDFKGKKLRTFASKFQSEAWSRLGVTPIAMSLGDVLPALQQGTIDGAVAGMGPFTHMHFSDAARYITMTNQPAIFLIAVVSKKWYESLPPDLRKIIDKDGAEQSIAIDGFAVEQRQKAEAVWKASGGEEINLPADEQAQMMKTLSSVGADVSKSDPQLAAAYKIVTDAAARAAQTLSQ
ncbi:MAG: TRAP transporter substrate-binding protein [Xanthobacteraceae bacterium]